MRGRMQVRILKRLTRRGGAVTVMGIPSPRMITHASPSFILACLRFGDSACRHANWPAAAWQSVAESAAADTYAMRGQRRGRLRGDPHWLGFGRAGGAGL